MGGIKQVAAAVLSVGALLILFASREFGSIRKQTSDEWAGTPAVTQHAATGPVSESDAVFTKLGLDKIARNADEWGALRVLDRDPSDAGVEAHQGQSVDGSGLGDDGGPPPELASVASPPRQAASPTRTPTPTPTPTAPREFKVPEVPDGETCCPLPVPGIDDEHLDRFSVHERCSRFCPYKRDDLDVAQQGHFCFHASPKSGSSVTLAMLHGLVDGAADVLGYTLRKKNGNIERGMTLYIEHRNGGWITDDRKFTKHKLPVPDCNNIVVTRDIRDQLVSFWHFMALSPVKPDYCAHYRNHGSVDCFKSFRNFANYMTWVLTRWTEYNGFMLLNYPTVVSEKRQTMRDMLDFMGFDWRSSEANRTAMEHVMDDLERKLTPDKSKGIEKDRRTPKEIREQGETPSLEKLIHFRSGKTKDGYLKELSPEAVSFLNSHLCDLYPMISALWGVDCPRSEKTDWWSNSRAQTTI